MWLFFLDAIGNYVRWIGDLSSSAKAGLDAAADLTGPIATDFSQDAETSVVSWLPLYFFQIRNHEGKEVLTMLEKLELEERSEHHDGRPRRWCRFYLGPSNGDNDVNWTWTPW